MIKDAKSVILYHRSYRKLPGSVPLFLLQFLVFAMPFSAFTLLYYPEISGLMCRVAEMVLSPYFSPGTVKVMFVEYIDVIGKISAVSFLHLPGQIPTGYYSLVNALVCLLAIIILPQIERYKPLMIFLIIVAAIHLISSIVFLFPLLQFPYDATDYSRLYVLQQISIWFFVPVMMGLAVMPLPSGIIAKCLTMIITFVVSLIFGGIRYIVFLFILSKISLIYMALLFFALGPLIDFAYIVGIYSLHVTKLANKMKGDYNLWKWQYS